MKKALLWIWNLHKTRLFIFLEGIVLIFGILTTRLYHLQIVQGKEHQEDIRLTTYRTMPLAAPRGNIYDRWGVPLAENKISYCIKYDLSVAVEDLNTALLRIFHIFDRFGETYINDFPISEAEPYAYTFSSEAAEMRWKRDMGFQEKQMDMTAKEAVDFLKKKFEIPEELSKEDTWRLLSARSSFYLQRYKKYVTVLLATDISSGILANIKEHPEDYPAVLIEPQWERVYPGGEAFSHVLGYVGTMNEDELSFYKTYGYTASERVGKLGIEKEYELLLNGTDGKLMLEVDSLGRKVQEEQLEAPIRGGDVFLTLDSRLQKETAEILKETLKSVFLQKYHAGDWTTLQVLQAMIDSNAISIDKIMAATAGEQLVLKNEILEEQPDWKAWKEENREEAKACLINLLNEKQVSMPQLLLCLQEQEEIILEPEQKEALKKGSLAAGEILLEKIIADEIGVHELNLDPCTGSVVVLDVNTGEVLSLVSYPSYDNNQLVPVFNGEYYQKLLLDPTTPLINRPVMERKAPGSTLKMVTAVAGLEEGAIQENTVIRDQGVYQDAGKPYAKCLVYSRYGITHGNVNVKKALEVSCNYFFYELAYRFGNAETQTSQQSILVLDEYMKKFGLDHYSGIEIEESKPKMASPEWKEILTGNQYHDRNEAAKRWMDGDSIRAAIGQSYNSFAAIHMAKYIGTLANGGNRMKLSLVHGTREAQQDQIQIQSPVLEAALQLNPQTVRIVKEGMLQVTHGTQGTLRKQFKEFPIEVAAKTGTAEEANKRPSHSWFVGFAPYEQPQIAVVVMIPFGESKYTPDTIVAKKVIEAYFQLEEKRMENNKFQNVLAQ